MDLYLKEIFPSFCVTCLAKSEYLCFCLSSRNIIRSFVWIRFDFNKAKMYCEIVFVRCKTVTRRLKAFCQENQIVLGTSVITVLVKGENKMIAE